MTVKQLRAVLEEFDDDFVVTLSGSGEAVIAVSLDVIARDGEIEWELTIT